jgi:spore coat protein CotH
MDKILRYFIISFLLLNFSLKIFSQSFQGSGGAIPDDYTLFIQGVSVSGLPEVANTRFGIQSVCIDIDHPNVNELIIWLISPDNSSVRLAAHQLGSNFKNTCFNSTSFYTIDEGFAPFSGEFRPVDDLGKFNFHKNPNGNWALRILDVAPGSNSGFVNSWSINFSNSPAQPFISSDHPIMVINTNDQTIIRDDRIMVDMGVISNSNGQRNFMTDNFNHYNGKASIRYRGQSSMMFPKKSYALDTKHSDGEDFNFPLLGMPSEHKWVLLANYNDKTLVRENFTYELGRRMGHYSARSIYVDLVIDGNYMGLYLLTEKIKRDKNRVAVSRLNSDVHSGDDLTGGYIVSLDKFSHKRDGWHSKYPSNTNNDVAYFQYEYPRPNNINESQKNYIQNYFHAFEDVLINENFRDPDNGYRKYIDVPSFIDNFIVNELSRDIDAYRISSYFYKDRDSKGGKIINGPLWDYDMAWYNSNMGGGDQVEGWQYQYGFQWEPPQDPEELTWVVPFWWSRFMEDPAFTNELYCRYHTLRLHTLSEQNLFNMIDATASSIKDGRERNFSRWPLMGKWVYSNIIPVAQTYEEEIAQMKSWISQRLVWLDNNIPGFCNTVGTEEKHPVISSINVFPNPFRDDFNLNYYLRENSQVSIDLLNAVGIRVHQIHDGVQTTGMHQAKINTNNLPNGIYIVTLRTGDNIYHHKMIKNN